MPLFNPPVASAGASALDANGNLVLPAPTAVTTPAAGAIAERVITRAGESQLAYGTLNIPDLIMQQSLENSIFFKGEAFGSGSGSACMLGIGCTVVNGSGTLNSIAPTMTNVTTSRPYGQKITAATAATAGNLYFTTRGFFRGNAARRGGFKCVYRFAPVLLADQTAAFGITDTASDLTGDASAFSMNFLGMIADAADTNWQFFSRAGAAAGTKIDSGLAKIATGSLLALYLVAAPGATSVQYQLENEETQVVLASGSMTLTLPTATTPLNVHCFKLRTGASAAAASVNVNSVYGVTRN